MSTMFEQATQVAETQIKKLRWLLGLSGALSIALGVVIIAWPKMSLYTLVIVFGAFVLARGIVGLATAIRSRGAPGRGWLTVASIASIAVGVIVFLNTEMSALALLYVIGAYAIGFGVITVGGAFWLPLDGRDSALLALGGVASILFGVIMFAEPGAGALAVLALIAAYALVVGVSELVVAIGGTRLLRHVTRSYTPTSQPSR